MSDTVGSLVDKLCTVDLKMWNNQELLYEIRKMSFEDYCDKYFKTEDGAKKMWGLLKICCDLNCQRNNIIDEIDQKIVEMIQKQGNGPFVQPKHKTY